MVDGVWSSGFGLVWLDLILCFGGRGWGFVLYTITFVLMSILYLVNCGI